MTSLNLAQEPRSVCRDEEERVYLERRLRFGQAADREAAATLLAAEGRSAISPLVESLTYASERSVRLAAATSLCRIKGDSLDVQRLRENVSDEDLDFMLRVIRARWRYDSAAPFLLYRVEGPDIREACCAVRAVVRLLAHAEPHSQEAMECKRLLEAGLNSASREVRLAAVRALGRLDHPDALMALTPHLSMLAKCSHRGLVVASLATLFVALLFGYSLEGAPFSSPLVLMAQCLQLGCVLGLVIGGLRMTAQRVSGSRGELEQVLSACTTQDPERVARIRDELRRIASPLAGQSPEAQVHARELLRRVQSYEARHGSLPIAASIPEAAFEELPKPAAAPGLSAESAPAVVKVW